MPSIAENISSIRSRVLAAAEKAGRDPAGIVIVAATKGVAPELIREAVGAGITDIGENRVQEARSKFEALKDLNVKRHMIGHLQTNKVKQALELFSAIQSVDSERLARAISAAASTPVEAFIEVNTSGEESKYGVAPEEAVALAQAISKLDRLKLKGLMTIGPLTDDVEAVRKSFRELRDLFERIKGLNLPSVELKYMSMGMSDDFESAVIEGSNMLRLGRAIFGQRR